ncbi:MAG: 16S rRNA (uracil(1498)-N(3))-methyltransferase [Proteobacteria bacterium]|nr:16S rRNA (uracil(1498)-N(3))-methyltransferase [Pseudomonadota bacterium]
MRLTRVFVDGDLQAGQKLTVDGGAGNHIVRVLRSRVGDRLTVFNGRGGEHAAAIDEIRRDTVLLNVLEHRDTDRESAFDLTLAQGISRGERMDWVVQKATELGVTRIAPVFTERSVVHLDEKQAAKKVQHWRGIAVAACEQCGRNVVPVIDPPMTVYELLEKGVTGAALLLSPGASLRITDAQAGAGATVLIGPEGGLAQVEQDAALRAGFTAVRMGPRVLRTETAAVCALTLLQQKFGDL